MDTINSIENLELIAKLGEYDGVHLNYKVRGYYSTRPKLNISGYYCKCGNSKRRLKKCECNLFEMDERSGNRSKNDSHLIKYTPHDYSVTKESDGVYKIELTSLYVENDSTSKNLILKEDTNVYFIDILSFEKTSFMVDGQKVDTKSFMGFSEHTIKILEIIKRKMPSEAALIENYFKMVRCIGSLNYGFPHEHRMEIVDEIEKYTDRSILESLETERNSSKIAQRILKVFDTSSIYEVYEKEPFLVSFCGMVDHCHTNITCKKDLISRIPDSLTEIIGFLESFSPNDLNRLSSIYNYTKNLDSNDFVHILEVGKITGLGFLSTSVSWKSITECIDGIVKNEVFEVEDSDLLKARQDLISSFKKYLKETKGYIAFNKDGYTIAFKDWYYFTKNDPIQKIRDFAQHQLSETLKESIPTQSDKFEIFLDLMDTDVIKALEILNNNKALTKKEKEEIAKLM